MREEGGGRERESPYVSGVLKSFLNEPPMGQREPKRSEPACSSRDFFPSVSRVPRCSANRGGGGGSGGGGGGLRVQLGELQHRSGVRQMAT